MKNFIFFTCFAFFSFSLNAQTTWYISTTGNDTNNGLTPGTAFATVNNAIGLSACGDSIYVLGGTYHEKINAYTICPENNRLVIQGDTANRPLIIGDSIPTNKYAIGASGAGYTFRHLELTSPYPDSCAFAHMVIVGSGNYFDFIDLIVRDGGYDGIKTTVDCSTLTWANNWRIIDCHIYNNGLPCVDLAGNLINGDGVDFTHCYNCEISNSTIKHNNMNQVVIKMGAKNVTVHDCNITGSPHTFQLGIIGSTLPCDPSAVYADSVFIHHNIINVTDSNEFIFQLGDVVNFEIENNTVIIDSITSYNGGFMCIGCSGTTPAPPVGNIYIRNNIFINYGPPFVFGADSAIVDIYGSMGTEVLMNYNLYYDSNAEIVTPLGGGANSLVTNPLFCDYPFTYELGDASPCINTGDPSSPNDPDGSINDIGARYYQTPCNVGIQDENSFNKLLIYPNPSNGTFNIVVDEAYINGKVEIYNALNQKILNIPISGGLLEINLSEFPNGIYFFKVNNMNDSMFLTGKLMKN